MTDLPALLTAAIGTPTALVVSVGGWRKHIKRRDIEVIAREDARREQREVHRAVLGDVAQVGLVQQVHNLKAQVEQVVNHTNGNLSSRLDRIEGLTSTVLANQEERATKDAEWRGVVETRLGAVESRLSHLEDKQ